MRWLERKKMDGGINPCNLFSGDVGNSAGDLDIESDSLSDTNS